MNLTHGLGSSQLPTSLGCPKAKEYYSTRSTSLATTLGPLRRRTAAFPPLPLDLGADTGNRCVNYHWLQKWLGGTYGGATVKPQHPFFLNHTATMVWWRLPTNAALDRIWADHHEAGRSLFHELWEISVPWALVSLRPPLLLLFRDIMLLLPPFFIYAGPMQPSWLAGCTFHNYFFFKKHKVNAEIAGVDFFLSNNN